MPKQIERGPTHIYPRAVAERLRSRLAAYNLTAPPVIDAGSAQRALFSRHPVSGAYIDATPQRMAAAPSMEYAGFTPPAQQIVTAPSLANADRPTPGLLANPFPAGDAPPILPTRARIPVV